MSVPWRLVAHYQIMNAKASTWIWNTIDVRDYRNIVVCVSTSSSASLTLKAQWAIAKSKDPYIAPDFSASQSVSNSWGYLQIIDLDSWWALAWSTWIVLTWTDIIKLYEVNVNSIDYLNFSITARVAWSVTIDLIATNNV